MAAPGNARGTDETQTSHPVAGDGVDPWLEYARDCQKGVYAIQADFTQELFHPLAPNTAPLKGTVAVRRGGKVRLEYANPSPMVVVSNGAVLWSYDRKKGTCMKSRARDSLLLRIFDFFVGRREKWAFDARRLEGPNNQGADLPPLSLFPANGIC